MGPTSKRSETNGGSGWPRSWSFRAAFRRRTRFYFSRAEMRRFGRAGDVSPPRFSAVLKTRGIHIPRSPNVSLLAARGFVACSDCWIGRSSRPVCCHGRRRCTRRVRKAGSLVWTSAARPPSQAAGGRHPQTRVDRKPPAGGARPRVRRGLAPPTRPQRRCQPRHPPPPDPDPQLPPTRHVLEATKTRP